MVERTREKVLKLGKYSLPLGKRTLIMGILNITPDSFSDGGRFDELDNAMKQAQRMVAEGMDIVDIGGESTRPGSKAVSEEEELKRVIPVVEKLVKNIAIPISIDTYKSRVAKEALEAGAHMINDVWGLKKDPDMAQVIASFGVPVCIMHNREKAIYESLMIDILRDLEVSIKIARDVGIEEDKIIIDPGIGFAKNMEQNLEVMNRLQEFEKIKYPLLLGTSRKSMIGKILDLPVTERVEGTAATVVLGIAKGAEIIRVHDIKEMKRVAVMTDAMIRR